MLTDGRTAEHTSKRTHDWLTGWLTNRLTDRLHGWLTNKEKMNKKNPFSNKSSVLLLKLCFILVIHHFTFQDSFRNIGFSIVKVSVMMIGEFEYDTTFVESINSSSETTTNPLNPFPEISMIFIYIFLFLMSIILMNLLVRLFRYLTFIFDIYIFVSIFFII